MNWRRRWAHTCSVIRRDRRDADPISAEFRLNSVRKDSDPPVIVEDSVSVGHLGSCCAMRRTSRGAGLSLGCGTQTDPLPSDSVVYQRFEQPGARRHVLVRDTDRVSELKYRDRAKMCGYRSVVAFPLREPMILPENGGATATGGVAYASLIGFLAIDAPHTDGFAALFSTPPPGSQTREDGEDLEACPDIDLFYGLADALATILVLRRSRLNERGS